VPTLGVLPWLRHGLPDEDGAFVTSSNGNGPTVAIVRYPTASNLDEYKLLEQVAHVRWAMSPAELVGASLVVLPGSKHVAADLAWLRATGIADALATHDAPLLGICGGLQMLGRRLDDPHGIDGSADALGLLPLVTRFERAKTTRETTARFGALAHPWAGLSGRAVRGYEIRHGETTAEGDAVEAAADGLGFAAGRVLGISFHGLFEDADAVQSLLGAMPERSLEHAFDLLADAVEEHLDLNAVLA
jgi:adenosylcobyric acid synthase